MEVRETATLREKAYDAFKKRLFSRDIRPGQFLSQRELVEVTGMPLGAIRELVPRLEADGLIKTVPQRGMQIAHVDVDLIRNAFQLRLILEREAAAEFCRKAEDTTLLRLRDEHLAVKREASEGVTPDLLERAQQMDWLFHDQMIDTLGNALISSVYRVNSIKIRLIRQQDTRMLPELVTSVMDEHMRIIDALVARDEAGSVQALEAHIDIARRRALGI
ncbi:GntR family transcriptional regulator [Mesorhizobium microcysteis]|uniref:GntR family transcriptional regulator n=1 Tax=Neoaquamicrobium microcysteis TaxID=2682781 RepID=A0A5D4GNC3_9HYPH|nr:GntR family transcriptional regulator [Mesorhizobium microcysteis]